MVIIPHDERNNSPDGDCHILPEQPRVNIQPCVNVLTICISSNVIKRTLPVRVTEVPRPAKWKFLEYQKESQRWKDRCERSKSSNGDIDDMPLIDPETSLNPATVEQPLGESTL